MNAHFQKELEQLLNKYSVDNSCNIPDWILAYHLVKYLETLQVTMKDLKKWEKQ